MRIFWGSFFSAVTRRVQI